MELTLTAAFSACGVNEQNETSMTAASNETCGVVKQRVESRQEDPCPTSIGVFHPRLGSCLRSFIPRDLV